MSLASQVSLLATRAGQEAKALWAAVNAKAPLASPALTGTPTAPTAIAGTSTTQVATTAFVNGQGFATTSGVAGTYAPLSSPALTGTPTVPTAVADANTTQAASTAFVLGQASSMTPGMDGTAAVGTATRFARADHLHPTDTSRAPLASPALTGIPTAPTASAGANSTQIATTAYVDTGLGTKPNLFAQSTTPPTFGNLNIWLDMSVTA